MTLKILGFQIRILHRLFSLELKLSFREELKTLLKDCLLNIRASETDGCKDIASDKLHCLLNTIRQDNSLLVVLQREKKRFGIDSHQKELLCLAILSDTSTRNNKELIQVSDHILWYN